MTFARPRPAVTRAPAGYLAGRAGFSLAELVVVMLVIGVLTSVASPRLADTLNRSRVTAAAARVAADLNLARRTAIATSAATMAQFVPGSNSYLLPGIDSLNDPGQPYALDLSTYPYHCEIVSALLGGDSDVSFDFHGRPDSGGTITLRAGGFQETVTIDPDSGRAAVP